MVNTLNLIVSKMAQNLISCVTIDKLPLCIELKKFEIFFLIQKAETSTIIILKPPRKLILAFSICRNLCSLTNVKRKLGMTIQKKGIHVFHKVKIKLYKKWLKPSIDYPQRKKMSKSSAALA